MKKITSLMALLLMFIVSTAVNAQDVVKKVDTTAEPLITDASQITSPHTDPEEGSIAGMIDGDVSSFWHSNWHNGDQPNGTHYFQVEIPDLPEEFGFSYTRRNASNDQITVWGVYAVPSDNPNAIKEDCIWIEDVQTPRSNNTETLVSPVLSSKGYTIIRFYAEETTSNRGYFHVAEFQIYPTMEEDARQAAYEEMMDVFTNLSQYSQTFEAGDQPGQYNPEAVQAFEASIEAALALDGVDPTELTMEQINKIKTDMEETYAAVQKARVPYAISVEPGYYYIKSALDFTTTTPGEEIEDPETGETITTDPETIHHIKAIYTNGANAMWMELNDSTRQDANFIWKITEGSKPLTYHLINAQNETQIVSIPTSSQVKLDEGSDSLVVFDTAMLEDVIGIRLAANNEGSGNYLHCNNHGGGSGVASNIVGWYPANANGDNMATGWKLEAIDEATALAIIEACSPAKKIKAMNDSVAVILASAPDMFRIAEDVKVDLDLERPLITDASQFSSPYSQNDLGGADGQDLSSGCLIDKNASTFWHSYWGGGDVANGTHYLQIADIDTSIDGVAFYMQRRATTNDHVTKMSVYGFNEDDVELIKDDGELLAQLNFPNPQSGATINSEVFLTKGYPIIRIYADETNTWSNNLNQQGRGYWHAAEVQLYPATIGTGAETVQAQARAAEIAALKSAIEAWNAINMEEVTDASQIQSQFDAITKAWEAFKAVYVDPAALRNAIAAAPDTKVIKIGTNPGEWNGDGAGAAIVKIVADAKAYDNKGKYTPAESEKFIADLAAADSILYASANQIKTGKWYKIRFNTEAECEENGWDPTPASPMKHEATGVETTNGFLGKYVAAAKHVNEIIEYTKEDGNNATVTKYVVETLDPADNATQGANVAFLNNDDITEEAAALWQFVAIGDTAYVMQNKLTGLYLRAAGGSGATTLDVQPTLYNVRAIGYGKNLIKADAITGDNNNYLHGERATMNLVTWDATAIESNSALYLEEAGDVTEQPSNEYTKRVWPGQVYTMCYPVELEAKDGTFYVVAADSATATVTLSPIEGAVAAGKAVAYIKGSTDDYKKLVTDEADPDYNADNYELATFVHGTEFVAEPVEAGSLVGSLKAITIGLGKMWASQNNAEKAGFVVTANNTNNLGANTAYIDFSYTKAQVNEGIAVVLEITDTPVTKIADAIATVSKVGGIYTLDGKFVAKGNANSLKAMPKGIYVVNGVKVAVK